MEYVLKHRDTDVAEFRTDEQSKNVDYLNILDDTFSPVNGKASDGGKLVSFNGWIVNRCIPNSREGVERLKTKYKIDDMRDMMLAQYGLSLSDHYWIDRKPFNHKWENINLYENRYSDVIGKLIFDKHFKFAGDLKEYDFFNPDVTTGGMLRKYWKYNEADNTSYLIKGGSSIYKQEPFNEYFAALLFTALQFEHTPYFVEKEGGEWVSVCPCTANAIAEMVSADDIRRKYGIDKSYNSLVKLSEERSCPSFADSLNKMILADYLIDNTDRHWNNFGILRDGLTGSWICAIPLFDNGYSLWNNDFVDINRVSTSLSFEDTNEECLKYVDIGRYIKSIPPMISLFDRAFEYYENKERKRQLRNGIREKQRDIGVLIEKSKNATPLYCG